MDRLLQIGRLRGFPEKMIPALVFTPTKPKEISHEKTRKNTENFLFQGIPCFFVAGFWNDD